jgi:hypothetical protein
MVRPYSHADIMRLQAAAISEGDPIIPIMLLCINAMPIKAMTANAPMMASITKITLNIGELNMMKSPLMSHVSYRLGLNLLVKFCWMQCRCSSIIGPVLTPRVKEFVRRMKLD